MHSTRNQSLFSILVFFLLVTIGADAQVVSYTIWGDNVYNDQIVVEVEPATPAADTAFFVMPMSIPGTYAVLDYGRFVTTFNAFDANGEELESFRSSSNDNVFVIPDGDKCSRVEYILDDSFDDTSSPTIFHPAGTSFETDSLLLLNFGGIAGYFKHNRLNELKLTIHHPEHLYASSATPLTEASVSEDVLEIEDYDKLIANPVMYTVAPPTIFEVDGARIVVALQSPNNKVSQEAAVERLKPIVTTVAQFFGEFPVPSYAFMVYAADMSGSENVKNIVGFGALEHPQSSVYFMPETGSVDQLNSFLDHAAVHEIFHVFLPLYLHSEEIAHFNFEDPEMSEHLWLYEGVTEYFSQLSRMRSGMLSEAEYMQAMANKIKRFAPEAEFFKENPNYLEFSKEVLEPRFKHVYGSVYSYGALQAMDLDLYLLRETNGEQDLFSLLKEVSEDFGPDKPFKDEELFTILQRYTDADLLSRLEKNLVTDHILNYHQLFGQLGWSYAESDSIEKYSFGIENNTFRWDSETQQAIVDKLNPNLTHDLLEGDVLLGVNDMTFNLGNAQNIFTLMTQPEAEEELTIRVQRNGEEVVLTGTPTTQKREVNHFVRRSESDDNDSVLSLREQYLQRN